MEHTIITHFDSEGYKQLEDVLSIIADEKICRVPYGRVEDGRRYQVDTLPYHLTVSSSKDSLSNLISVLGGFRFTPFDISLTGLDVMPGKNNSRVLYFKIAPSIEIDSLQRRMYELIGNEKYLPGNNIPHITLCISRDFAKIERIRSHILKSFVPFNLGVSSLGLYEIWPGKLIDVLS